MRTIYAPTWSLSEREVEEEAEIELRRLDEVIIAMNVVYVVTCALEREELTRSQVEVVLHLFIS